MMNFLFTWLKKQPEMPFVPRKVTILPKPLMDAKVYFSNASDNRSFGDFIKGLLLLKDYLSTEEVRELLQEVFLSPKMEKEDPLMFRMASTVEITDTGFITYKRPISYIYA